jgi:prephenate dehydrogenase
MEAGFRLQDAKIAIVGLGLMGGSLALALKGRCAALYGIDSDRATLELALKQGIVDQVATDPTRLLSEADLVVLATPVRSIIAFVRKLPSFIHRPCVVLDLGSTKHEIVETMAALPERFDPIGGHPICGKEKLGLENAQSDLYEGAPFVITALDRTTRRAKSAAEIIISTIGAKLIEISGEEHDRILALTSHLPFLLASALALSTPPEFGPLVGTGFKSTSRLAGTPAHMMQGVLQSNRENILKGLHAFRISLDQMEAALQNENDTQLELLLNRSRSAYQALTRAPGASAGVSHH